ncbi:hypothetical protein GGR52DRAFT_569325 [Hypoxylon sp. FL1284]|nr:hypothetical protein GGR52DRAFT_569325 [Hypoxylon sp. FL1284]
MLHRFLVQASPWFPRDVAFIGHRTNPSNIITAHIAGLWEWGSGGPEFIIDAMPYFDLLQRDLGLNPRRKGGGREQTR